jgi:hypothetical protein
VIITTPFFTLQERIKLVLLSLAREATLAALDDLTARVAQLASRPATLDGYMGYLVGFGGHRVFMGCLCQGAVAFFWLGRWLLTLPQLHTNLLAITCASWRHSTNVILDRHFTLIFLAADELLADRFDRLHHPLDAGNAPAAD